MSTAVLIVLLGRYNKGGYFSKGYVKTQISKFLEQYRLSYTDLDEGECDRRFDAHERHFIVVVSRLATSRQCQQSIQPAGVRHGPLVGRPRGVAKPYTEAAHVLELELAERRRAHEMNC